MAIFPETSFLRRDENNEQLFLRPANQEGMIYLPQLKSIQNPFFNGNSEPPTTVLMPDYGNRYVFKREAVLFGNLHSEVKKGGHSYVSFGYDDLTGTEVALKLLDPSTFRPINNDENFSSLSKAYFREAHILSSVSHPHLVKVNDVTLIHSQKYRRMLPGIIMEKLPGETLTEATKPSIHRVESKLSTREIAQVVTQMADVIDYLHSNEILINDVKAENVMVTRREKNEINIVLFDGDVMTKKGDNTLEIPKLNDAATQAYESPERIRAAIQGGWNSRRVQSPSADQFSLVRTAYIILADSVGLSNFYLRSIIHSPNYVEIKQYSREVNQILAKGMEDRPENRYSSCKEFASELTRALQL